MKRVDTFMFGGELGMLECHLTEMDPVMDVFVIVEADVTHGDNAAKPYHYLEHSERFSAWADRIVYVQAKDLPNDPNPWSRELGQRNKVADGLARLDLEPDDLIFHGDLDEIPTRMAAKSVRPKGLTCFQQKMHPFAVDWFHPQPWGGTVVGRVKDVENIVDVGVGIFGTMRDYRMRGTQTLPLGGWHFSWVSDSIETKQRKIREFCHPEIAPTWENNLDDCYETGLHVDGIPLEPVEVVKGQWPVWITDGNPPAGWYRPRDITRERPEIIPAPAWGPTDKRP